MLTKECTQLLGTNQILDTSLSFENPTMTITSSDVSNGSSSNQVFIEVTFTSSENTSDFTIDDIETNNGQLLNFSGHHKVTKFCYLSYTKSFQ